MKNLNFLNQSFQKLTLMLVMLMSSIYAIAQDTGADVVKTTTTSTTTEEWYTNPLYLIIGGVVLVIIIALIARGNGNKS